MYTCTNIRYFLPAPSHNRIKESAVPVFGNHTSCPFAGRSRLLVSLPPLSQKTESSLEPPRKPAPTSNFQQHKTKMFRTHIGPQSDPWKKIQRKLLKPHQIKNPLTLFNINIYSKNVNKPSHNQCFINYTKNYAFSIRVCINQKFQTA